MGDEAAPEQLTDDQGVPVAVEQLRVMRLWQQIVGHKLSPARAKEFSSRVSLRELAQYSDEELRRAAPEAMRRASGNLLLAGWRMQVEANRRPTSQAMAESEYESWEHETLSERIDQDIADVLAGDPDFAWEREPGVEVDPDLSWQLRGDIDEGEDDNQAMLATFEFLMRRDDLESN